MKLDRIQLMDIEVGDRLRTVDREKVAALRASIELIGLRTPPTVALWLDAEGDTHYHLVAGAHRLAALRLIQPEDDFVDAFVMDGDPDDAALWEIDENFARAELTDAQRADHHVRREEILKRKGLVRSQGRPGKDAKSAPLSYADQAAGTLGVSKRTVQQDLQRGKNIAADVLSEVAGTSLDKGVVLDELARTPQADQHDKLAEIAARRREPKGHGLSEAWAASRAPARALFLDAIDAPAAPTLKDLLFLFYSENPDEVARHGNEPDADPRAAAEAALMDARARGGDLTAMAEAFADDGRPTARAIARLLARVALD